MNEPCVSVVMPVYNEEVTVALVIGRVLAQPCVRELVVVEDCSRDRTAEILAALAAKDPRIRLFRHKVNQGKGAAMRTGFREATAPIVIVQDADLEYDPAEYPVLIAPILDGDADVVYGSRFIGSSAHRTRSKRSSAHCRRHTPRRGAHLSSWRTRGALLPEGGGGKGAVSLHERIELV